jgi:SEC-C motif-containing protein
MPIRQACPNGSRLDCESVMEAEMSTRRNDPCPCGSGRKYKRCCSEGDQARQRNAEAERERNHAERDQDMAGAIAKTLRAVMAKDSHELGALLSRFASALTTDPLLVSLRFDDGEFASAVERSLSRLGRAQGPKGSLRLFRYAMTDLGSRRVLRRFHEMLTCAMKAADSRAPVREAVAAALVCLEPVLAQRAMRASESPTLEIIFNVQLETWMAGHDAPPLKLA